MKALREKGAVKLQMAGTKSADQALLALRDLNLQYSQLDWAIATILGQVHADDVGVNKTFHKLVGGDWNMFYSSICWEVHHPN